MADTQTTAELITEIREQVDETNELGPVTDDAILRVMNRGQRIVNAILANKYKEPLLKKVDLDLAAGAEHDIPNDCFADMAEYIEIRVPGSPVETRRRMYRDSTSLESTGGTPTPRNWTVEGRVIRFFQTPSGTYDARLWYVRRLEKLLSPQGRITSIGSNYLIVDSTGTDLTSSSDELSSYINVVNGATGEVRASYQITSILSNKITLRTTPLRSTVKGRSIESVSTLATSGIEEDDYVCISEGTCIPFFQDVVSNYIIQYAVAELSRSGGDPEAQLEQQVLEWISGFVKNTWAGRESTARVKSRSSIWRPRPL